ncbi:MAG: hypothetical protein NC453_24780 [Muribaculum sp.]|nr:hypothetical protein [Muribaculum sp.]
MKFNYIVNANIPQAAWCLIMHKRCESVDVELGQTVPHNDNFFFSGVWDGEFSAGDFINASFVCGTGAKLEWGGVRLCASTHLLESIYIIETHEKMFASNSLSFVLKRSECKLDFNYMDYQRDMCSSLFGSDKQVASSPLADGFKIEYLRGCTATFNKNLECAISELKSGLKFSNYDQYISKIRGVLNRLETNAKDEARIKPYGLYTTISRGYDATATSALAKEIGCDRALTFSRPKAYSEDNGTEIAQRLGYRDIIEADANKYLTDCNCIDAENMSTGDLSAAVLNAYKDKFANCLLFTGARGDSLWERNHINVNDRQDFTAGNTLQQASHSMVEACLEMNAVCVPVPMIGADCWTQLAAISQSEEMKPWSVCENYDRPIARRIVEEKGVPREWFGLDKHGMGSSFHFDTYAHMKGKMSKSAGKSLDNFKKTFKQSWIKRMFACARFYFNEFPIYFNYIARRLKLKIRIKSHNKHISSPLSPLLINWAIMEMQKRY